MSPGSIAATQHGNRGGGWAPRPTRSKADPGDKPPTDPTCTDCKQPYSKHTDHCRACNLSILHHEPGREDLCWTGLARCAHAKRARLNRLATHRDAWPGPPVRYLTDMEQDDLDRGLTGAELEALRRHPEGAP